MNLYIKQKLFSLTQDFDIYDVEGQPVYHVKGKFFTLSRQQHVYDVKTGEEVAYIRRKIIAILPKLDVFVRGSLVESIRKKFTVLKPRYQLAQLGWTVEGNILAHEYEMIDASGQQLASIRKRFLAWSDTFEVAINQEEVDPVIVLAVILAIDSVMDEVN